MHQQIAAKGQADFFKEGAIMKLSEESFKLLSQETTVDINELISKDGLPIFELRGYVTNSKYNPIKEAKKISKANYKKNHFHVLLGIGSGYVLEELYSLLDDTEKILIIEPNQKLIDKLRDIQCINDIDRVKIIAGIDLEHLEMNLISGTREFNNRLQMVISPNYDKIYPIFTKKVMLMVKEAMMLEVVNRNTLREFADNWQENFIKSLFFIHKSIPFIKLNNKLECPIVIASGGPSLSKQIQLIKNYRDKFFLLCAGTTINTLLDSGIYPDAIVVIDGSLENYNHFKDIKEFDIPLFYSTKIHHGILKKHKGKKIIFNEKFHTESGKIINSLLNYDVGEVTGGGSVANYSLDIAYKLTSGPICLIGQDLAYTNNISHAEGNKSFTIIDERENELRKTFEINGYYGSKVLTDYPFLAMKKGFEVFLNHIKEHDESRKIYNCTEGGALIEGCENLPFATFLDTICEKQSNIDFNKHISEIPLNNNKWEEMYEFIYNEKHKLIKVKKLCVEALNLLLSFNKNNPKFNIKVNMKLDKLDEQLRNVLENELLFYLFGEVIFNVNNNFLEKENETILEKQKRIYLKTKTLYEGIKISSEKAIVWYEELLDIISKEI